jgi:hypothetical protein
LLTFVPLKVGETLPTTIESSPPSSVLVLEFLVLV